MDYKEKILDFKLYILNEEKSKNTVDKYLRDIKKFYVWFDMSKKCNITKELLLEYKDFLINTMKKTSSVNSNISSLNAFFNWASNGVLKIKLIKLQKVLFEDNNKNLLLNDVKKLIEVCKIEKHRLIIETIVSTGIRVSEIKYITVNSVENKRVIVCNKGKERIILIPTKLCEKLIKFCKKSNIKKGVIFVGNNDEPINRKQIWRFMKNLCDKAYVDRRKVFPHNLRHLFAREYLKKNNDIVKLASILGHNSIETTRIYTLETEDECRNAIEKLNIL